MTGAPEVDLDEIADWLSRNWSQVVERPLVAQLRDRYGLTLQQAMRVIAKAKKTLMRAGRAG